MDRSRRIIYSVVTLLLLLVIIALVMWPKIANECVRQRNKPDLLKSEVLISDDGSVMGSVSGYLAVLHDNTYLPIKMETISQTISGDARLVTLSSRCIVISVHYKIEDLSKYHLLGLDMFVKDDTLEDKNPKEICHFDREFTFFQPSSCRYSCEQVQSHRCSIMRPQPQALLATGYQSSQHVANLVLNSLELEFDRDKSSRMGHTWNKIPWNESCRSWRDDT